VLEAAKDCNSVLLSNTAVNHSIKGRVDNITTTVVEKQHKQIFLYK
jgi:hypothetical protein